MPAPPFEIIKVSELIRQIFPKTIEVKLHLARSLPAVLADRNQINQALLNIYVNARDAMPTGGELVIATELVEHGPNAPPPSASNGRPRLHCDQ
jgi:signal transduction histidine kinase